MRRELDELIPEDFTYWLTVRPNGLVQICFQWKDGGESARIGAVGDFHLEIAVRLLKGLDWMVEREHDIEARSAAEIEQLRHTQARRKSREKCTEAICDDLRPVLRASVGRDEVKAILNTHWAEENCD